MSKKTEVHVILTNRRAYFRHPYPFEEFNDILKYRKPGWEYTNAAAGRGWDGYLHVMQGDKMGAGAFLAMRPTLERICNVEFLVEDKRESPLFLPIEKVESDRESRPYQYECVEKMIKASLTGGLVLNATGTGKTFIAGMYLKALQGSALFVVDELTLLKQAREELSKVIGEEVGEIGNGICQPRRITVGTIQTIHKNRFSDAYMEWTAELEALIIDEVHLALNRRNFETVTILKPPVVFGLTATLQLKRKHVALQAFNIAGPTIFTYPLKQGVSEGYLSKGVAIGVQVNQTVPLPPNLYRHGLSGFALRKIFTQRYAKDYKDLIVNGDVRNETIHRLIREAYRQKKYTIVLLERVGHLKEMSRELRDIPHETVFGDKVVGDRVRSKKHFEKGEIRLLLVNKVFKKGVDIKRVDVLIDAAGMKSRNDTIQKYGRGVRMCEGKNGLLYFDIADVGNRFEKAAEARRRALKREGVPYYTVDSEAGAEKILRLAQKRLEKILDGSTEKQGKLGF